MITSYFEARIPNLGAIRQLGKDAYREIPIDNSDPRYREPVVDIRDYGVEGSSYYSQPNKMTCKPLPGVRPEAMVRIGVAERLQAVNNQLKTSSAVSEVFGGPVALLVRDALRSYELQRYIYEEVWPEVLRQANPNWSDEDIGSNLPNYVAKPSDDLLRPTPHMTGGAVDVNLVYPSGDRVHFGHIGGKIVSLTDYHEDYNPHPDHPIDHDAQLARRVLYHVMRDSGFENNPTEWWHFSHGDQMWAFLRGEPAAFYGAVSGAPDKQ